MLDAYTSFEGRRYKMMKFFSFESFVYSVAIYDVVPVLVVKDFYDSEPSSFIVLSQSFLVCFALSRLLISGLL